MAKGKLPKSLTKVTTFSKLLATFLIVIFFLFAFYLGMQYQKEAGRLVSQPTQAPSVVATSCQTDSDCTLSTVSDTRTTSFCCGNTKCLDLSQSNVKAVNRNWIETTRQTVCSGRYMCPMIATLCTRQITENNSHYQAKCIQDVCQKVRE